MLAYIVVLMLCLPSIVAALAMATCARDKDAFPFNPAHNRCDASYLLAFLLGCVCIVYATIWVVQNGGGGKGGGGRPEGGAAAQHGGAMGPADPFGLPPLPPFSSDPFSPSASLPPMGGDPFGPPPPPAKQR